MIQTYFDTAAISDLALSLHKEYLITSPKGFYSASALCNCNVRKYHGLLVAPQPAIDDDEHVLVSSIDETLSCQGHTYELGTHKYPNVYHPEGYHYLYQFYGNPVPKWVYQVNNIVLSKEILFSDNDDAIFIRYTLEDAPEPLILQLTPFLAFRNKHTLSKANVFINKKILKVTNGIRLKPYSGYSDLFIQLSTEPEFIQTPDWYYNIEYPVEQERGYEYHEDLYTPGHFKLRMKKGDQVVLSAGLVQVTPKLLKSRFSNLLKKSTVLNTMEDCLLHAAGQFIVKSGDSVGIKAGYYWFGKWGRDTFISLPGLTLVPGHFKTFKAVVKSMLADLKKGLFPNAGSGRYAIYNTVDASLWFVWVIQQYALYTNTEDKIWKEYGKPLQNILSFYKSGTQHRIKMDKDALISAGEDGVALTWMDAVTEGNVVTPRIGKPVEINALWYNAVCFCLKVADKAGDKDFVKQWKDYPEKIETAFLHTFWDADKRYLADYVNGDYKDWSIRPNQIFAVSLPFSPVSNDIKRAVIDVVKDELLTPRGLRTLSPADPQYKGVCYGTQEIRDSAYHQGTVWPWLLGHFAEACLKEYQNEAIPFLEALYKGFEPALKEKCLYTVAEIYNGDAPYWPQGAVSQAWSIAELIRMKHLITTFKSKKEKTVINQMA